MKMSTLVVALSLGLGGAAQAADLTTTAAPQAETVPSFSWTGLYFGAHAGHAWSDFTSEPTDVYGGVDLDGFFGGGQAGFNYQFDNRLVLGIEADLSFLHRDDAIDQGFGDEDGRVEFGYRTRIDNFGTVRGRVGYAAGRVLPYVTGGLAWADAEMSFRQTLTVGGTVFRDASATDKQTFTGWTLGAGLEYAVTNNLTARIEYLHADLGSRTFDIGSPNRADLSFDTVRLGLNYKF